MAALLTLVTMVAACTNRGEDAPPDVVLRTPPTTTPDPDGPRPLRLGVLLPRSGVFALLGEATTVGVDLALEEIEAGGGVLGQPVEVIRLDSGSDANTAASAVAELIGDDVNGVVGPASGVAGEAVLGVLGDTDVAICSPSIAAVDLGGSDPPPGLIRTMPTDELTARALGNRVAVAGHTKVAILAPDDTRGEVLTPGVVAGLGTDVEIVHDQPYDPTDIGFDDEAGVLIASEAEALVLLARDEGIDIIRTLRSAGFDQTIWITDQLGSPDLASQVDTDEADLGDVRMVWAATASSDPDFSARFAQAAPPDTLELFAAHAHDCVLTIALAAQQAGTTDPSEFARFMAAVSRLGHPCSTWVDCRDLIAANEDIDFDGASGPLDLHDGVPTGGWFETVGWTGTGTRQTLETFAYPEPAG
ncbi:MAG: amino acid ABC transporter substrate-binding protein [Actinomycetia bacterium]|nr:amino acid ABC transporter substrate-binding protein [Actinomycetes bacterium]